MLDAATASWMARLMPTPADRRHGVRRVADAEQARQRPILEAIDRDGEQLDIVPVLQLGDPVAQERGDRRDLLAEGLDAPSLDLVESRPWG